MLKFRIRAKSTFGHFKRLPCNVAKFFNYAFICCYHNFHTQISWFQILPHIFHESSCFTANIGLTELLYAMLALRANVFLSSLFAWTSESSLCFSLYNSYRWRSYLLFRFLILDFVYIFWRSKNIILVTSWKCRLARYFSKPTHSFNKSTSSRSGPNIFSDVENSASEEAALAGGCRCRICGWVASP